MKHVLRWSPLLLLAVASSKPPVEGAREPVALVAAPGTGSVYAACADGDVVRLDGSDVVGAWRIASSLSDLVALDDGQTFVATDPEASEVVMFRGEEAAVVGRRAVERPTSVVQAGAALFVGSMSGRTLTRLPLTKSDGGDARGRAVLALPFPPGEMIPSNGGRMLVVADAAGSWLAVVDIESMRVVGAREIPGHNIRGLALSKDGSLAVAHQIIDSLAHTSFDDVHWGNVLRNVVREIDLGELLGDPAPGGLRSRVVHLGDVGNGAGDPSSLAVDADGRYVVTLAGTDELLFVDADRRVQHRIEVGRRPVDAISRDGGRTYTVANSLGGSVSFVPTEGSTATELMLGPAPADDLVARGRRLFFDASLSHDGWMSCHSCHTDGHSPGLLADTLGDGSFDTPKRILSLLGSGETAPYGWTGELTTLEAQIEKTLRDTMHAEYIPEGTIPAIAAFLRTLPPPSRRGRLSAQAERGGALFRTAGCTDCHAPPFFTTPEIYDVGVADESGALDFNPPSLRGVGRRARLFHDGRYRDIETLLANADHPGTEALDERGLADIAAYLRTL